MAKIKLEEDEVQYLIDFVKKGQKSARELTRARILLLANKNKKNTEIVEILNVGRNTEGESRKGTWMKVSKALLRIKQEPVNP